jgi:hypothetical protein
MWYNYNRDIKYGGEQQMASGSQLMTTYYAKRIIGDTAAENASSALL